MDYNVKIDEFEGPLDLLLHLVNISNISIYDISIDEITKQYLDYINKMEELNINVASSYLVMAAELMEIKSRSLLPNNKEEENSLEEEEVSRESLINRLIEYQKYKEVTKEFRELEKDRRDVHTKAPSKVSDIVDRKIVNDTGIGIDDLVNAFENYLKRKDMERPINTKVTNKEYSVRKRKESIREYLKINGKVEFTSLFKEYNKSYIIVTFLSILELSKESVITITQDGNFTKIYLELKVE